MKKYLASLAMLVLLSGCYYYPYSDYDYDNYYHHRYHDRDDYYHRDRDDYYRYNRYSDNIKTDYGISNLDNGIFVADNLVKPAGKTADIDAARLRLAGDEIDNGLMPSSK